MRESLIQGASGRVLLDRNVAFYFLDESSLRRNRQIRLIRNIDYQIEYFMGHVSYDVIPTPAWSPAEEEVFNRTSQLSMCGENLAQLSSDLVVVARGIAIEALIPAEVQVFFFFFFWISHNYFT